MLSHTKRLMAPILLLLATPLAAAQPKVGAPAPEFTLTLFDKSKVTLAELRGKVVILNFWATWCGPCKRELPLLDTYFRARHDAGLAVYAVATEDSLAPSQLKPLAALLSFPMARSIRGPYQTMGAVPTNYIIGRDGIVRYAKAAAFTLDDLNGLLVPLLQEPPPPPAMTTAAR